MALHTLTYPVEMPLCEILHKHMFSVSSEDFCLKIYSGKSTLKITPSKPPFSMICYSSKHLIKIVARYVKMMHVYFAIVILFLQLPITQKQYWSTVITRWVCWMRKNLRKNLWRVCLKTALSYQSAILRAEKSLQIMLKVPFIIPVQITDSSQFSKTSISRNLLNDIDMHWSPYLLNLGQLREAQ